MKSGSKIVKVFLKFDVVWKCQKSKGDEDLDLEGETVEFDNDELVKIWKFLLNSFSSTSKQFCSLQNSPKSPINLNFYYEFWLYKN